MHETAAVVLKSVLLIVSNLGLVRLGVQHVFTCDIEGRAGILFRHCLAEEQECCSGTVWLNTNELGQCYCDFVF